MSSRLPPFLFVLMCGAAIVAPAMSQDSPPIPFDEKKSKTFKEQERSQRLKSTLDAYRTVGSRNAKWDAIVEKALIAGVDQEGECELARSAALKRFQDHLDQAIQAGCDDPLVRHFYVRFVHASNDISKRASVGMVRALDASKYPEARKAQAWLNAAMVCQSESEGVKPSEADLKTMDECFQSAVKLLALSAKDTDRSLRKDLAMALHAAHDLGSRTGRRKQWFDQIETEILAKLPKDDPFPHLVRGTFYIQFGWDARGIGLADTVSEEGWKKFRERLGEAEQNLTAAWGLDKECAGAAAGMITVCMALGHPRETMEKWFIRALEADPNLPEAFAGKFTYLLPRWKGSGEELLAFARQVAKAGRWDVAFPMLLIQAHNDLAKTSGDFRRYLLRNWDEIEGVLEQLRKHHPTSPLGASHYLYFASTVNRGGDKANAYVLSAKGKLPRGEFRDMPALEKAIEWAKLVAALGDLEKEKE
jgi:GNAT superfamily N-acetyltransferase